MQTATEKMTFTGIDEKLHGVKLYQWSTGLRMDGCLPNGRRIDGRVHFNPVGLTRLPMYQPRVLRELRKLTGEVWRVLVRSGRFWRLSHYLVPPAALAMARRNVMAKYGPDGLVSTRPGAVVEASDCEVPF